MRDRRRKPIFDDRSRLLDRFGLLLIITISSLVILSLVNIGPQVDSTGGRWQSALASLLVGATLLLALRASGLALRLQRAADIVVVVIIVSVGFLAAAAPFLDRVPKTSSAAPVLIVLLALAAPVAVIRRLLQHREVSRGTLLGAISGYLLLPIAFFYLFLSYVTWSGTPFFADPQPTTSFMYFSLTTITSTGFGDLTAVTPFGRLLAVSEAISGQVYLVTFVAMLVGLFAASRGRGIVPTE